MTTKLVVDTADFPQLLGQEVGRELELEIAAVVTSIGPAKGGSPSSTEELEMTVIRLDITQTT